MVGCGIGQAMVQTGRSCGPKFWSILIYYSMRQYLISEFYLHLKGNNFQKLELFTCLGSFFPHYATMFQLNKLSSLYQVPCKHQITNQMIKLMRHFLYQLWFKGLVIFSINLMVSQSLMLFCEENNFYVCDSFKRS